MLSLTELQRDAITEVINIAIGRAAAALNEMVGDEEVRLSVPRLDFISRAEAARRLGEETRGAPTIAVKQEFSGQVSGDIMLIFPETRSLELVRLILRDTAPVEGMTELEQEALVEVGNVLLNACLGSLANMFRQPIESTLPVYLQAGGNAIMDVGGSARRQASPDDLVMFLHVEFALAERDVHGYLACVMDIVSAQTFREYVDEYVRSTMQE